MMQNQNFYPAKILLFGEYSIIAGSRALATPLNIYSGSWQKNTVSPHVHTLQEWVKYIEKLNGSTTWDITKFEEDINNGLDFNSSIPLGYGLGSSGALVAGFYDQYTYHKSTDIAELKEILSLLESFFHGKSSGIDPIVSYIRQTVFIGDGGNFLTMPELPGVKSDIFFLNSGRSRKTEPLVKHFQHKMTDSRFKKNLQFLVLAQEAAIDYWLQDDYDGIFKAFEEISKWQWENMSEFIPEGHQQIWKEGLDTGDYFLKLCGAGGGGATLGIRSRTHKSGSELTLSNPVFCFSEI